MKKKVPSFIYESSVIAEFASNLKPYDGLPLWPHEAKPGDLAATMATSAMKLELLKFNEYLSILGPAKMARYQNEEKNEKLKEILPKLEEFYIKNMNGKNFFGGDEPMYLDFHCYP